MRVTLSCVSRVLIFSSWMFVTLGGNFHPTATISAFYLTVLIMIIFNIVFNKSRDICTFKYWIGKHKLKWFLKMFKMSNFLDVVMNSYSCVLNYNNIDYQAMLDKEKNKKFHESTLIRQFLYFLIFFLLTWSGADGAILSNLVGHPNMQELLYILT